MLCVQCTGLAGLSNYKLQVEGGHGHGGLGGDVVNSSVGVYYNSSFYFLLGKDVFKNRKC